MLNFQGVTTNKKIKTGTQHLFQYLSENVIYIGIRYSYPPNKTATLGEESILGEDSRFRTHHVKVGFLLSKKILRMGSLPQTLNIKGLTNPTLTRSGDDAVA